MSAANQTTDVVAPIYPPTVTPPPWPLPLGRFLITFVRNPLRTLPQAAYDEPLSIHRLRGGRTVAWVSDPGLIEQILLHQAEDFPKTPLERRIFAPVLGQGILTAEGVAWRWQRRTVSPLFRHQQLLNHVPTIVAVGNGLVGRWRAGSAIGVRQIDRDMTDVTYDVITHTILAGGTEADGAAIKRAAEGLLGTTSWEIAYALAGLPEWVWHPGKGLARRGAVELREVVGRILARRRVSEPKDDLLGRLLAATDPETEQPMADEQLIDNLLTFLLAGHETTAKALTWSLYLLARAPDVQGTLRAEVLAVCGTADVGASQIDGLVYTRMVLKEAMRLYPPVAIMSRLAGRDLQLGGQALPKGTSVLLPIYAIHRHTKLWVDPGKFDPERFTPEAEAGHQRTQYMPFGFGPRTCIGNSFAMIEATALLATFVRAARFDWDGHCLPEPVNRVTLRPKGGMPLRVTALT